MAIEVGKTYYFMPHAYHHYIAEVVEINGTSRFWCKNIRRIYSCKRGWTEFFRDGAKNDTNFTHFPPGEIVGSFGSFIWRHAIPGGIDEATG